MDLVAVSSGKSRGNWELGSQNIGKRVCFALLNEEWTDQTYRSHFRDPGPTISGIIIGNKNKIGRKFFLDTSNLILTRNMDRRWFHLKNIKSYGT